MAEGRRRGDKHAGEKGCKENDRGSGRRCEGSAADKAAVGEKFSKEIRSDEERSLQRRKDPWLFYVLWGESDWTVLWAACSIAKFA